MFGKSSTLRTLDIMARSAGTVCNAKQKDGAELFISNFIKATFFKS